MTREEACAKLEEALQQFEFAGEIVACENYGSGHINDTFHITAEGKETKVNYILQRMNHEIFTEPEELMENVIGVTSFLRKKIIERGGDPERETLNLVSTHGGQRYYKDSIGSYWRVYQFINGAVTYDLVEKPDDFYQSAVASGNFQSLLSEYPAHTLHETIKDFHNTAVRFHTFQKAVKEDVCHRAAAVQKEIQFVLDREEIAHCLPDMQESGKLPLRVTHNDTKLNNIMIDNETGRAICVIDLDTVMPGLAVNDFGDSIRFGASTAAEDEVDLSKVRCSMELYRLYVRGFMEGCGNSLTKEEIKMLPMGAKTMTYECGMRFLTDYLQGDTYFRIHRENHNLDRCRTQFKLVADMEEKWDTMTEIVNQYCK